MTDTITDAIPQQQTQLETQPPQKILRHAVEHFGQRLAVVTSFQITGVVTLHMLQDIMPDVRVYTLDTGLLFPETYALMDELEQRWELNLTRVQPQQSVSEQADEHGEALWVRNADLCCHLRKVVPLREVLTEQNAWISGVRRDQSAARANTPVVGWDERNALVKYNPFAMWTEDMLWAYIGAHDLPYNALYERGYPSIGCAPCTRPVVRGRDARAGRWTDQAKTECGIHARPGDAD